jgi:hypothetical protein
MTPLAALTSIAGDPLLIHKKVGWNNFVTSFSFKMCKFISEFITYGYVGCIAITLFLHLVTEM